ncbi:MAG: 2Fe-2S iron-sulfur cluster binding domain-containing protein [Sphingomonas sp.]|uniref:2Fe-2S iron-sulfur cluster-binding protein n=1 Tax=Sphingomonas sp. TaxID=28214 RepID=UPI0018302C03|nr:2Fe-2S iron-sulfur cluster-binding protein [Sphingomonas sp.]MBA3667166.1 2Fe-2S iron-sulfur cluster binding domain-containing protein [Sphingomonas sp.]
MAEHFYPLKVAEIVAETDEANSIRFEMPAELRDAFRFRAGQHLTLRTDIGGEEVRRNYSLCVAPDDGQWLVTVKRVAGGVFSNWVGDALKPGDTIDVMPPHGSFTTAFDPASKRRYVAFAGGSGITPVISLIRTSLSCEPGSRFTLFYGNRESNSVIFLEALAALKDRYMGRFELYHFLSDEEGEVDLFNGMLDRATCDAAIGALVDEPDKVDAWFICGPGPMMDAAEAALTDRYVAHDRIHIERFIAGKPSAAAAARQAVLQQEAAGLSISVTLDGRTRKVQFDGRNILDSARDAGLPAPFACKAGVCATCRAKVLRGKVDMAVHYGLSDEEVAAGYILTCQSVPCGEGVAVDYDA